MTVLPFLPYFSFNSSPYITLLSSAYDWDYIPFKPVGKLLSSAVSLISTPARLYLRSYIAMHCEKYIPLYMCVWLRVHPFVVLIFLWQSNVNGKWSRYQAEVGWKDSNRKLWLHTWKAALHWPVALFETHKSGLLLTNFCNKESK